MVNELLLRISHCESARQRIEKPNMAHPCSKIVDSQNVDTISDFQVPEPWSGRIDTAPILFLSSNPSISDEDVYPTWDWSSDEVADFFNNRFGGGARTWISNGTKALSGNGEYLRATQFWAAVRQRAIELIGEPVVPGQDYALTEIVHCKSRAEIGVIEASRFCADRYLDEILRISGARVIVVLGKHAQEQFTERFGVPLESTLSGPMLIGGRSRLVAYLPHPNARGDRTFAKLFSEQDVEQLRRFLNR